MSPPRRSVDGRTTATSDVGQVSSGNLTASYRQLAAQPDLRKRQGGFSLVEVMVGITVGLVTVLIITQTMSLFQGGRNTIIGGTSAQENGLFAMQLAATDIRSTGAGYYSTSTVNSSSLQSCNNVCSFYGSGKGGCSNNGNPTGGSPMASISGNAYTGASYHLQVPLFPVIIESLPDSGGVSGGIQYGAGSDIITVRTASRFIGSIPAAISSADMGTSNPINLLNKRTFGFADGDLALISDGSNCTVFEVKKSSGSGVNPDTGTLSHESSSFNPSGFEWPSAAGTCPGHGAPGQCFDTTAMVYNLGTNSSVEQGVNFPGVVIAREYSISGNGTAMQMRQYGAQSPNADGAPIPMSMADGIVTLKAQYGLSVAPASTTPADITACANSPSVTHWVGPGHSAWSDYWAPDTLDKDRAKCIRAIRILVVARSGNREASEVTAACGSEGFTTGPCPSGGATETDLTLPAINFSGLQWAAASEWKHYRYKTYMTVVPIRNILWNGAWNYTGGTYTGQ